MTTTSKPFVLPSTKSTLFQGGKIASVINQLQGGDPSRTDESMYKSRFYKNSKDIYIRGGEAINSSDLVNSDKEKPYNRSKESFLTRRRMSEDLINDVNAKHAGQSSSSSGISSNSTTPRNLTYQKSLHSTPVSSSPGSSRSTPPPTNQGTSPPSTRIVTSSPSYRWRNRMKSTPPAGRHNILDSKKVSAVSLSLKQNLQDLTDTDSDSASSLPRNPQISKSFQNGGQDSRQPRDQEYNSDNTSLNLSISFTESDSDYEHHNFPLRKEISRKNNINNLRNRFNSENQTKDIPRKSSVELKSTKQNEEKDDDNTAVQTTDVSNNTDVLDIKSTKLSSLHDGLNFEIEDSQKSNDNLIKKIFSDIQCKQVSSSLNASKLLSSKVQSAEHKQRQRTEPDSRYPSTDQTTPVSRYPQSNSSSLESSNLGSNSPRPASRYPQTKSSTPKSAKLESSPSKPASSLDSTESLTSPSKPVRTFQSGVSPSQDDSEQNPTSTSDTLVKSTKLSELSHLSRKEHHVQAPGSPISSQTKQVLKTSDQNIRSSKPSGYVGFGSLPDQVYRRAVRKGFEFSLMVVGESGLGKSTLVNSMFLTNIYQSSPRTPTHRTVEVETHKVLLEEKGVKLSLTVIDTPGFGDSVDNRDCWEPVIEYIENQFDKFLDAEQRVNRVQLEDTRVHVCLYFIAPTGHGLRELDVQAMKRLHDKVNIVPVIGKSDSCTKEELNKFKTKILSQLKEHSINIYEFPATENNQVDWMRERLPFAVVGSNTIVEDAEGRKVRGREYPWGVVNIEDSNHCDFSPLRNLLLSHHMQDLKDVTNTVQYETYRYKKLTEMMGEDSLRCHPLAQMEREEMEHKNKVQEEEREKEMELRARMEGREEDIKLKELVEQEKLNLEMERIDKLRRELMEKKEAFIKEVNSWEEADQSFNFRPVRSEVSLSGKKHKYGLDKVIPFKFGRT